MTNCETAEEKTSASALRWPITAVNLMQTRCHISNEYASRQRRQRRQRRLLSRRRNGHSGTQKGKEEESVEIHVGDTHANHGGCALIFRLANLLPHRLFYDDRSIYILRISE